MLFIVPGTGSQPVSITGESMFPTEDPILRSIAIAALALIRTLHPKPRTQQRFGMCFDKLFCATGRFSLHKQHI